MKNRRLPPRPTSGEAPFALDEVFYSRTDDRGVIETGNHVFARVSGYDWSELIGAPQKIVRHPDMPKAVFWLFWDRLKNGRPVGAYVKNRAKDGLHYWVFAATAPCGLGFLSARIKPSSPILQQIETLYCEILEKEKAECLSPEQSASNLLAALQDDGFATYDQFAGYALAEELNSRSAGLHKPANPRIHDFQRLAKLAAEIKANTEELVAEFDTVKIIPQNMRIIASRLEPSGGPISTLSKNYGLMSDEISQWFERNVIGEENNFSTIRDCVTKSMFVECMAEILSACIASLQDEQRDTDKIDIARETDDLSRLMGRYQQDSTLQLKRVAQEGARIVSACDDMRRHALGLNTTRIMAKIEGARSHRDGEALGDVIEQLRTFQERIDRLLVDIARKSDAARMIAAKQNRAKSPQKPQKQQRLRRAS